MVVSTLLGYLVGAFFALCLQVEILFLSLQLSQLLHDTHFLDVVIFYNLQKLLDFRITLEIIKSRNLQ